MLDTSPPCLSCQLLATGKRAASKKKEKEKEKGKRKEREKKADSCHNNGPKGGAPWVLVAANLNDCKAAVQTEKGHS